MQPSKQGKGKQAPATPAAQAASPVPTVAAPAQAATPAPAAPAPAAPVPLAQVQWAPGVTLTLTKSLTAQTQRKAGIALGAVAAHSYTLGGTAAKLRSAHNLQMWGAVQAALAAGTPTAAAIQALLPAAAQPLLPAFLAYAVKTGWVAVAKASA